MNKFISTTTFCVAAFMLAACGGGGGNNITETNTAPVATSGTASTPQNTATTINLQATDADGDTLTYSVTTPQNGAVSLAGNVATYTPTTGYTGADSFSFTANDSVVDSNTADIDITVSAPSATNTAPTATAGTADTNQDTDTSITLQATDAEGDSLTYSISTPPQNGTASLAGDVATYTPNAGFTGTDSFAFIVNDGEDDSSAATVDITVSPTSSILGRITTADGSLVTGAEVNILDASGASIGTETSTAAGEFVVTNKTDTTLMLSFSKDGFANQVIPVRTPDGQSFESPLDVVMIEREAAQTISIDTGGTLNGSDGASVTVAPDSFVDASGNPVTGDIQVNITPVDISNQALLAAFPGEFSGIVESTGLESPIASLGTVEFVFTQNGEPLQLADGMTAEILIPIYTDTNPATGNAIQVGDVIALWSLNETTGIWLQEGTGTVVADANSPTGFALSATVSHFTWWNCDVSINPGKVTVTVDGSAGLGVAKLNVRTDANIGYRPPQVDTNITIGTTSQPLFVPGDGESCFWVDYYVDGLVASTDEQCITIAMGGTYSLTFNVYSNLPLEIAHSQNDIFGLNITASPILLRALSLEQSVSYSITSGSLPNGMSLVSTGPTKGQIQGVPTESGSFSLIVEGTDSDGNISTTNIAFDVINLDPPSFINSTLILKHPTFATPATFDMTQFNIGGPATSWSLNSNYSISNNGLISIPEFLPSLLFTVTATNDAGSSSVIITTEIGTM